MENKNLLDENPNNKNLLCPNLNCINIPEISYKYEPLNSFIGYKCICDNNGNELKMELSKFIENSSRKFICPFCKLEIKQNDNFVLCRECSAILDYNCYNRSKCLYSKHRVFQINQKKLYNNCLMHNNTYIFLCLNCHVSLCGHCDLTAHNSMNHELKQLINFSSQQNAKDKIIFEFEKQKRYLNKIKEMNNNIMKSLENDIMIKQKIIENYKNNKSNYNSIKNFNQLSINNNEKYEIILKKIIQQYDENKNNNNQNNDNINNLLIDQILSPFYYNMMINCNQKKNNELFNLLKEKIIPEYNEKESKDKNEIKNNDKDKHKEKQNKKKKIVNNKKYEKEKDIKNESNSNKNEIKDIYNSYKEIKTLEFEKPINNMIILNSGNIAISYGGNINIYNANNICSNDIDKDNSLIQKITISKNRIVSYIYEFPDETLLCSATSKIYRIKLINNDTKFNLLGIIKLSKSELPTKLISLGNIFLLVLSEQKKLCHLKLFIKNKYLNDSNVFKDNKFDSISNDENDDNNSSFDSGIKQKNYFSKDLEKEDREFQRCNKTDINADKKLLCSIFEIKKSNNIIINNEYTFEFIATSNYTYDLGDNRIEFYKIKKLKNDIININRTKKIENISCSTEADSICQLNDKYLCIGLQNFDLKGQISGYAIIDINQKEIWQIIKDNDINSLNFIKEKNLLMAAMEVRNPKGNYNMIKMFKVIENEEKKIEFKKICQFKSQHQEIIVDLNELKIMNCAPIANDIFDKFLKKNIICVSASKDSTLRIIETKI